MNFFVLLLFAALLLINEFDVYRYYIHGSLEVSVPLLIYRNNVVLRDGFFSYILRMICE
jgi:hypothetical protein